MGQVVAPIGAVVGGSIGFYFGGWAGARFGASVGWLVGSWVGAATTEQKKENVTPENMPKFNTAIRGMTMPVIFGTNRVAAQIAWQSNFEAIRNADSGGKGGGSGGGGGGGGGKGAQSGNQPAYTYKMDAIYHLGLVPSPVGLIRIWNGSNAINAADLRNVEAEHENVFFGASPAEEPMAGSLEFENSIFFDGSAPAISSWAHLNANIGHTISWPGTAWMGFDSLNLGSSAGLPQLSFEIGPSELGWEYSASNLGKSADLGVASHFVGRKPDVHNNVWMLQTFDSGVGGNLTSYSAATGALLATYEMENEVLGNWNLPHAYNSAYVFHDSHRAVITNDGRKIAYLSTFLINDVAVGDLNAKKVAHILVGTLNSNGTISWNGSCWTTVPGLYSGNTVFGITGDASEDDLLLFDNWNSTNTDTSFHYAPAISRIEGSNNTKFGGTAYRFTTASYRNNWLSSFTSNQQGPGPLGAVLPENNVAGSHTHNRIYYYFGKGYVNGNGQNGVAAFDNLWVHAWRGTHANGGLVYVKITAEVEIEYDTYDYTYANIADPVAADNSFYDADDVVYSYFTDDWFDISDSSANTTHFYQSDPCTYSLNNGGCLVVWGSIATGDTSYAAPDFRPKSNVRTFIYNKVLGQFNAVANVQTVAFGNVVADYGGTAGSTIAINHFAFKVVDCHLYAYTRISNSGNQPKNIYLWIDTGHFNVGSCGDVFPPYIIKEILTNSRWGIYPGDDIIDATSYAEAIQYCADNSIRVSCVINQQESANQIFGMLLALYGGWLTVDASANKIKFGVMDLSPSPVRTIDNSHLVRNGDGPPVSSTKAAGQDTFNLIKVNYFDRNLDYEQNQIQEGDEVDQDFHGVRLKEFPLKFVMSELTARRLAVRTLWSNLYGRDLHSFQIGWKDADLEPGDLITLVDSFSNLNQVVQITRMEEKERGIFNIDATQQLQYIPGFATSQISSATWDYINTGGISSYTSASSPYIFNSNQGVYGIRNSTAFELPKEFEFGADSHVYVAWAAKGRPAGATLYVSADGSTYAPARTITPYQVSGVVLSDLPSNTHFAENVDLFLSPASNYNVNSNQWDYEDYLTDVSQDAMHAGAGLIWVGSEMLSFASLTLLSQNKYRAARVYRGWGGTPVAAHSSGDTFYKQGAGVFAIPYTANQIGTNLYYKVAPFGFNGIEYPVSSIDAKQYTVQGLFYKPRLPSDLQYDSRRGDTRFNVGSAGDIGIYWKDCGQQTGFGAGGNGQNPGGYGHYSADVASLGYHVAVVGSGSAVVRSSYVSTPAFAYTNSQNFSDNGAWRGNVAFRVTPVNPYGLANGTSVLSLELFF